LQNAGAGFEGEAVIDAHRQRLEGNGAHAGADHVIDELHDMAGTDISGVEDVRADRREDRLDPCEDFGGRADRDRDRAGIGAVRAAADRRVDHLHAFFGEPRRHLAGLARVASGHIGSDLAGAQRLGGAALAEQHVAHLSRSRQTGHHHVALAGERLRALRRHGAGVGKARHDLRPQVEDAHLVRAQRPRANAPPILP
jgi:hypothetical protein